ncbi:MAG: transporter [Xanthomonadaceae bacterium]|nr:transporter [Xanthomonadaceae bacterium]
MRPIRRRPQVRRVATSVLLMYLSACASYRTQPLDTRPSTPADVQSMHVEPAQMPLPSLRAHTFDPSDGLDITETAMLAVANNPDLRVARDDAGIARAQAFSAGLLPDPQISISADHPTGNVEGSNVNAFGLGISYDINALLRHSAEKASAAAAQSQSELELLWKEWQTVAQARLLFVRSVEGARNLQLLDDERTLFADRQARLRRAMDAGNVTVDSVATDYAALSDVQQKVADQERKLNQTRHDLNTLLGLAASAHPRLVGDDVLPQIDAERMRALAPRIGRIRPDLRALESGYRSQEEKYRAAVLAQFPALSLGFNRARDTSGIYSTGFNLSLSLPIFNGNRGNIAIEKATRQRLYDDYHGRLSAAVADIDAILDDRALAERQLADVRGSVAELERLAAHSQSAFQAGNIDVVAYVTQRDALLAKRMEALALEQALREQQVSLQTLFGSQIPTNDMMAPPK